MLANTTTSNYAKMWVEVILEPPSRGGRDHQAQPSY